MQLLSIGECMIEMSGGEDGGWRMGFAGDTLNTLWYARAVLRPEVGPVGYFTALGDDPLSERMAAFFGENGIETGLIRRLPGRRPGLYLIEQRAGDRHFTYWRETSAARRLADDEEALRAAMAGARAVYFSGITLAILDAAGRSRLIALAGAARGRGALVAFDPNIRPALWDDAREMRRVLTAAAGASSVALPSFDDEARAFGDVTPEATAARYREAGAEEVAVKNGGAPVLVLADGEVRAVPVPPAPRVVDPTAAGDSFNGAYLGSRLRGADPDAAARAGIAMAAEVIGAHGALIATPEMEPWRRPGGANGASA